MRDDAELAKNIVDLLNSAMEADPVALHALCINRVPCNRVLADHMTVIVDCLSTREERFVVGMIGIINGLLPERYRVAYRIDDDRRLVGFEVVDATLVAELTDAR